MAFRLFCGRSFAWDFVHSKCNYNNHLKNKPTFKKPRNLCRSIPFLCLKWKKYGPITLECYKQGVIWVNRVQWVVLYMTMYIFIPNFHCKMQSYEISKSVRTHAKFCLVNSP